MNFLRRDPVKVGGVLYIVAVFQFFVFELVAETLYPGYSVSSNYISDLGATCVAPPSTRFCVVHQPSAKIFDATAFLLGLMLLAGSLLIYRGTRKKAYTICAAVADLSIVLVGVFPEDTGWVHAIDSEFVFLGLGIALVLAWTIVKPGAVRYLLVAFGVLTLFFTVTNVSSAVVGVGGEERLLVLPALFGLSVLGGYLTGQDAPRLES